VTVRAVNWNVGGLIGMIYPGSASIKTSVQNCTVTNAIVGSRALTVSIPVGNLPAGIYLVRVKTAEGTIVKKIILLGSG
jgi:hypothetical protein